MCEPVTIGTATITATQMIMAGMAVAAGGVAAYGAHQSGKFQQQVAKNNAKTAEIARDNEMRQGAIEDQQQRWKIRALMGKQSAGIGANNVVSSSGSALDILGETAMFGEVDLKTIRNNAARRAWGYDVEKQNSLSEGKLAKYGGNMTAAGTLLSTGAQVAGMFPGSGGGSSFSSGGSSGYQLGGTSNTHRGGI